MAITKIIPINSTPQKTIDYCEANKFRIIKTEQGVDIERDDNGTPVLYRTIRNAVNFDIEGSPKEYFEVLKARYMKSHSAYKPRTKNGNDRDLYHFVQNFGAVLDAEMVNEIGRKFAEEMFAGYACVVCTHTNTEYFHNHIYFCAYSTDGRSKYKDNLKNVGRARQISDKLCLEYGLPILEDTQHMNLHSYKDKNGDVRFWEVTDRKIENIQKRERGELTSDDVNSYRNTQKYADVVEYEKSNRETIKDDIDRLINIVTSYDDLIFKLEEMGYEIKSKKQNGERLKHVSFRAPTQQRATRDSGIGDGIYYTRDALVTTIAEKANERKRIQEAKTQDAKARSEKARAANLIPVDAVGVDIENIIPVQDKYIYGTFDATRLHEDYRREPNGEGGYVTVKRGEADNAIVANVHKKLAEIGAQLDNRITHAKGYKMPYMTQERRALIVSQVQANLDALHTVESKRLNSIRVIIDSVKVLKEKYSELMAEHDNTVKTIESIELKLALPNLIDKLNTKMIVNGENAEYMRGEYETDLAMLSTMQEVVNSANLNQTEVQLKLRQFVDDKKEKLSKQSEVLDDFKIRVNEYEQCMATIERVVSEMDKRNVYAEVVNKYHEQNREEKRNEQQHDMEDR